MIIRFATDVTILYALFLGRAPEDDFVRQDNIGRPLLDLARVMIESEEFEHAVFDQFCRHQQLPHRGLSAKLLPDVLDLVAEAGLAPPQLGLAVLDWRSLLGRVLAAAPCRPILETRYGTAGWQFVDRLNAVPSPVRPAEPLRVRPVVSWPDNSILSGIEFVADAVCRGWAVDPANPDRPITVALRLNEAVALTVAADQLRRDVQELYGGDGRAGFTLRLDTLPEVAQLARATIEIVEAGSGAVILSRRVVEFGSTAALEVEAEFRTELARLRHLLDRLEPAGSAAFATGWSALVQALWHWRGSKSDTAEEPFAGELRESRQALERLELALPRVEQRRRWLLSFYPLLRPLLPLVCPPPASALGFCIAVIDDDAVSGGAVTTLESALGQSRKPDRVVLLVPAECQKARALPRSVDIGQAEPGQPAIAAVNRLVQWIEESHLLLLPAGATLEPEALAWFAAAIERTGAPLVFADGETLTTSRGGRERRLPAFSPAFDYDLLLQRDDISPVLCLERRALQAIAGVAADCALDPYHDLLLRVVEHFGPGAPFHLPQVLASCVADTNPDPLPARERSQDTVQRHFERIGSSARAMPHDDPFGRSLADAVGIHWPDDPAARILVVIPARDSAEMVRAHLASLQQHAAAWERVDVIVTVNGRLDAGGHAAFSQIERESAQVRVIAREVPFNWGAINNAAVQAHPGPNLLLFLNDDMLCRSPNWDRRLRGQLARPEIGIVGARLLYPNGMIQHAGIAFAEDSSMAHEAMGDTADHGLFRDRTLLVHQVGAVTGAFLACRRELFDRLGGFDAEHYVVTSSDADLCVRVRGVGKAVIYDPVLTWTHYKSLSRGADAHDPAKQRRAEAEHAAWRSRFSDSERVDLSVNPQLALPGRPFTAFRRIGKTEIELWLEAQIERRRQGGTRPQRALDHMSA